jgi:hypothetical protein
VLAPKAALALLLSPAPYLLSRPDFGVLGIPIVGHSAEIAPALGPTQVLGSTQTIRLSLKGNGRAVEQAFVITRSILSDQVIVLPDSLGEAAGPLPVLPGSVCADLRRLSRTLAQFFPWEERDAMWFVLTGQAPWILPIRAEVRYRDSKDNFERMEVLVSVEPWISARTLLAFFRRLQAGLLGGENRALGTKGLALFELVEGERAVNPRVSWNKLMAAWNKRRPAERYHDRRVLRRDYCRTSKALLFPGYDVGTAARFIGRQE